MEVIWSEEAQIQLKENLQYIGDTFGIKAIEKFIEIILTFTDNISKHPHFYPSFESDFKLHRAVIHKRLIIHYFVDRDHIVISTLVNTRMYFNPKKYQ